MFTRIQKYVFTQEKKSLKKYPQVDSWHLVQFGPTAYKMLVI